MPGLPDFREGWSNGGTPRENRTDTVGNQTTEDLARNGRNSGDHDQIHLTCPKCGDVYGNLPLHLPSCSGGDA